MAFPYLFSTFPDDDASPHRPVDRAGGASDASCALRLVPPSPSEADAEQVRRIRAGDDEAYGAIFLALYHPLREFAATYAGNGAVAEEVVQDVFMDLWVRRAAWDPQGSIRGYLFRAVRNRAINAARNARTALRLNGKDIDAWAAAPLPLPDAGTMNADTALVAALAPTLATLPPARRRAALLRWRFGLSYAEIATALETSVAAVTMHVARAREAVRPVVERYLAER